MASGLSSPRCPTRKPGRVEDLALKFAYDISERWSVTGGYRTVEGGADVDAVYNFAWFNAAVVSGVCRF